MNKDVSNIHSKRLGYPQTFDHFEYNRNIGFTASGVCLAIALTLIQIQLKSLAANIALISCSAALPLWMLSGIVYGLFTHVGDEYFHLIGKLEKLIFWFALPAGALLAIAVGASIYIVYPPASKRLPVNYSVNI